LEELFAGRAMDIPAMFQQMKRVADELCLPLGERKRTYNSRRAQELAKWAEAQGKGDEYHEAVFRVYFVEGKNIGKVGELIRLAQSLSFSGEEAQAVLKAGTFGREVDDDWSRARGLGITAVPTFVMHQQSMVGAQPYDILEQWFMALKVNRRPSASP